MNFQRSVYRSIIIGVLAIVLATTVIGCSTPADKVTVQLSWFPSVEYAGFYTALEKGYYTDSNIEVTLVPGGPDINPLDEVQNGKAQFGITSGDSIILAKAEQKDFVAVATIFKENPLAITSLSKDNIQRPEDLVGKTVGTYSTDLSNFFDLPFLALLSRTNIDRSTMKYAVIEDFQGANEIKAGHMDAMSGMFATDQQVMAQDSGDDVNFIYYKDYGYDVYINAIFTTEDFKNANPDLIRRFLSATMKGYQYALDNTDEAAGFAVKYDNTLDLAYQQKVMKTQIPFIDNGNGQLGFMQDSIWDNTQNILLEFKLLPAPIDTSTIYTNEFLPSP
jgi:ABC-type nitrate/sulfonate/bicarbonate transport system substrate-binding protein